MSIKIFYTFIIQTMDKKINKSNSINTEWIFARVFDRMQMLRKHKDDLLNVLNNIEPAWCVISKIQHESIITRNEYRSLKKFIEDRWLSTDIASVYENTLTSRDKEWTLNDLCEFTQIVENYPFVVDADEVREDLSSLLGDWIAEIRKNWKWWLVKKIKSPDWEDKIQILFDHNHSQTWILTFNQDEYDKYGLIEVKNYHKEYSFHSPCDTMFLQKEEEPLNRFIDLWRYTMMKGFDRDNIWFSIKLWWQYKILYKDVSEKWIRIYEIWMPFESGWNAIIDWFDSFNTFEAEMKWLWNVKFKKSYDDSWKLNWIYAFKKKRFGWEEQVRARNKKIDTIL